MTTAAAGGSMEHMPDRPATCTCSASIVAIEATIDPREIRHRFTAVPCGHEQSDAEARALWHRGMRWSVEAITGATLGAAERHRQIHEKGYTREHDDALARNDLTWAAWCLLDAAASEAPSPEMPKMWPLGAGEWNPEHAAIRRLVIAQALIAAELDRLLAEDRNMST